MPQTKEHLMLAKQVGVEHIIVYINKCDVVDNEVMDLVEIETMELLNEFGFDGDNTTMIRGSAVCALEGERNELGKEQLYELSFYEKKSLQEVVASGRDSILKLIESLDKLPMPKRDYDSSLLMPVSSSFSITGRGTVAVGTVERGRLKKGTSVDVLGYGAVLKTLVNDIHVFNKAVAEVKGKEGIRLVGKFWAFRQTRLPYSFVNIRACL